MDIRNVIKYRNAIKFSIQPFFNFPFNLFKVIRLLYWPYTAINYIRHVFTYIYKLSLLPITVRKKYSLNTIFYTADAFCTYKLFSFV